MSNPVLCLLATASLLTAGPAPTSPAPGGSPTGTITIQCPDIAKLTCGQPTSPENLGTATATTTCPQSSSTTITFADSFAPPSGCPADRFHQVILRQWTATDACGNSASCTQRIDVLRQIWSLDVLPGVCPNVIDTQDSSSTISLALAGTPLNDVAAVLPESLRLYTENCAAGPVSPVSTQVTDVTRTFKGNLCDCSSLGADGVLDLRVDFSRSALTSGLHLDTLAAGSKVRVVLTGSLSDGCTFIAIDCFQVQHSSAEEGCSHGYWKNHLSAWGPTGFNPADDFNTVFGVNLFSPSRTLLQALQANGGGIDNLGRQAVAALLSAAHPGVDFPLTVAQVLQMVQDAVANGTEGTLASQLDMLVAQHCPLN